MARRDDGLSRVARPESQFGFLSVDIDVTLDTHTCFRVGNFGERKGVGERGHWLQKGGDQKNESHAESGTFHGGDGLPNV